MLLPLDIVVALKFVLLAGRPLSFENFEQETGISSSSIHRSAKRLHEARLVLDAKLVQYRALEELIVYGVRYVYFVKPGEPTRGFPTAWAAAPLNREIVSDDLPPVWPHPLGTSRGYSLAPLHKAVPTAASKDSRLYELLAVVDAIRIGAVRERKIAGEYISRIFEHSAEHLRTVGTGD